MSGGGGVRLVLAAALVASGFAGISAQERPPGDASFQRPVVVGSKPFGEGYLLAELFAQLLEARGMAVERRFGLGGTEIVFPALRRGDAASVADVVASVAGPTVSGVSMPSSAGSGSAAASR